jgi:putative molybdopterin biosynthesis protein
MDDMLTTKQVAKFLNVNEKMVYALISEKGLPASKVTGKWLFPRSLVLQWVHSGAVNYPQKNRLPAYHGLVLIAGSNDLLLDTVIATFNRKHDDHMAMFGMAGSMGGLNALNKNLCHIAASHLVADNQDYNFPYLKNKTGQMPAVVNFCHREQGIMILKDNPKKIQSIKDLIHPHVRMVNRDLGTGTRVLFDRQLKAAGIKKAAIHGYDTCLSRHLDVGLSVLNRQADAGPGIRAVANLLGLDFISLCWERFDLLIKKDRFFDQGIQYFLSLLKGKVIHQTADTYGGYDLSKTGKMVYPEPEPSDEST